MSIEANDRAPAAYAGGCCAPTRREFLTQSAFGIGAFALAHLLKTDGLLAAESSKPGENLPVRLLSHVWGGQTARAT